MSDSPITRQQLIDGATDAETLAIVLSGAANRPNPGHEVGTAQTRQGKTVYTMLALQEKIIADAQGQTSFEVDSTDFTITSAHYNRTGLYELGDDGEVHFPQTLPSGKSFSIINKSGVVVSFIADDGATFSSPQAGRQCALEDGKVTFEVESNTNGSNAIIHISGDLSEPE